MFNALILIATFFIKRINKTKRKKKQGQVDDRDRTIRLQKNLIEKLEAEKLKTPHAANEIATKECVDSATQTERVCMCVRS